jgi:hypothetical protein
MWFIYTTCAPSKKNYMSAMDFLHPYSCTDGVQFNWWVTCTFRDCAFFFGREWCRGAFLEEFECIFVPSLLMFVVFIFISLFYISAVSRRQAYTVVSSVIFYYLIFKIYYSFHWFLMYSFCWICAEIQRFTNGLSCTSKWQALWISEAIICSCFWTRACCSIQ